MTTIKDNIEIILSELPPSTTLVAVSKFKPAEAVVEAYEAGQRVFAESRPQELKQKAESLPKDIQWHFIGHLQTNKIKMVVPYVTLIHSVDSQRLLCEIERYCKENRYRCEVLLELFIAMEETKQGFSEQELLSLLETVDNGDISLESVKIRGLMAMASFTDDEVQIRSEFEKLLSVQQRIKERNYSFLKDFDQLSFGMTNDYKIAARMGSTMVRIGTAIFGSRY